MYFGGIVAPLSTVPQFWEIWGHQNAAGVSTLTWSAYAVGAIFWIAYGLAHRARPILLCYGTLLILELGIIVGTLVYA